MTRLTHALGIDGGIVCAVGAGGKKSLLYAIAAESRGRIGLSATVHTAGFPKKLEAHTIIEPQQLLENRVPAEAGAGITAFACPSNKPGRLAGLDPAVLAKINAQARFDLCLVKADGARRRGMKAPRPDEPVVVPGCHRVMAVVSANVIGKPLDEQYVHRPELLGPLIGAGAGEIITTEHLYRLITSPTGSLQGRGQAGLTVVINQVDNDASLLQLTPVAIRALDSTPEIDRIVLTCLKGPPIVQACFTRDELV